MKSTFSIDQWHYFAYSSFILLSFSNGVLQAALNERVARPPLLLNNKACFLYPPKLQLLCPALS